MKKKLKSLTQSTIPEDCTKKELTMNTQVLCYKKALDLAGTLREKTEKWGN